MKKNTQRVTSLNSNILVNENLKRLTKTTNVNILLNRVRQDKKNDLIKKIILSSLLLGSLCLITFFVMI